MTRKPCPPGTYSFGRGRDRISLDAGCQAASVLFDTGIAYEGFGNTVQTGVDCVAGWYCPSGSTTRFQTVCPVHHYCPPKVSAAVLCPDGTWQQALGQDHCDPCPEGYLCVVAKQMQSSNTPVGSTKPLTHFKRALWPRFKDLI